MHKEAWANVLQKEKLNLAHWANAWLFFTHTMQISYYKLDLLTVSWWCMDLYIFREEFLIGIQCEESGLFKAHPHEERCLLFRDDRWTCYSNRFLQMLAMLSSISCSNMSWWDSFSNFFLNKFWVFFVSLWFSFQASHQSFY